MRPAREGCPVSAPAEDWDPLAPENYADPTRVYARLREECPVAWSERFGGFYAPACFEGTRGSCLSTVLEGEPDHRDSFLTANERKSNTLMAACVSRSMTERLILDW